MMIDTDKLKQAIDNREERRCVSRGGWEKCSMQFLTQSEKRVLNYKGMVADLEQMVVELLASGDWPV